MNKSDKLEQMKQRFEMNEEIYDELTETIGKKLISLRNSYGLTQQEVADIIGISRSALSYYEKAERTIDIEVLFKLANLYNVSIDYLVGMKETPSTEYDYEEMSHYKSIGFTQKALEKLSGNNEAVELICDLVTHKDFQELENLTHHSEFTRYESINADFRTFLTSKLLYSMMSDIYEKWYIDNDERIQKLSPEEKKKLMNSVNEYIREKKDLDSYYENGLENIDYDTFDDKDRLVDLLYKKLLPFLH